MSAEYRYIYIYNNMHSHAYKTFIYWFRERIYNLKLLRKENLFYKLRDETIKRVGREYKMKFKLQILTCTLLKIRYINT